MNGSSPIFQEPWGSPAKREKFLGIQYGCLSMSGLRRTRKSSGRRQRYEDVAESLLHNIRAECPVAVVRQGRSCTKGKGT